MSPRRVRVIGNVLLEQEYRSVGMSHLQALVADEIDRIADSGRMNVDQLSKVAIRGQDRTRLVPLVVDPLDHLL